MREVVRHTGAMAEDHEYQVKVWQDEDGVFIAECLDLDGCHSFGETRDAALEHVKEAIVAYLDAFGDDADRPHSVASVRIAG